MSIHTDFPLPWHITYTARHRARGYNSHIRAADDSYVAERITNEDLALYIVQVVNERDQLRADLAAANARAEAAEAKLAAVPDYAAYYATAWETFEANSDGPEPLDFAEWLAARAEVLP